MASGLSDTLKWMTFKRPEKRETRDRDRSLRGKVRVRARKAKQRAER